MAKATTKAAVLDEELETETEAELTTKQIISEGIVRVIEATGIDVQKNRYKAMRAIAYQAFSNAIDEGTFDDLVDEAIANVDELPAGWEIERPVKEEEKPVKAAPKKATAKSVSSTAKAKATKASTSTATKAAPAKRRRPTR